MSTYDEQEWLDGPAGGTPLSGARLSHIESGIGDALPVPLGIKEGDLVRKTDVGWEAVPADAYLSNSAVIIRGVLTSSNLLSSAEHKADGDGYLILADTQYDLYVWTDGEVYNLGPMNNIQGPPGIRGVQGPPGAGLKILGRLADSTALPATGNDTGDAYLVETGASAADMWIWDGTEWNNSGNVGLFSHSALSDLDTDDHPQYALVDGTRTITVGPVEPDTPADNDIWGHTSTSSAIYRWFDGDWRALTGPTNSAKYWQGAEADMPSAQVSFEGSWYWATDEMAIYYCDGIQWRKLTATLSHGEFKDLGADTHPQYINEQRGDNRYLRKAGGTMTGNLSVPNVQLGVTTLPTSGNLTVDFSGPAFLTQAALTGDISYNGINYAPGRTISIRIQGGENSYDVSFAEGWHFIGINPETIAPNRIAVLTVTSFGSSANDCVASWGIEF